MKSFLLTLTLLASALPAFAATPSLKENMKELGVLFREIGKTVADRTRNEANAKNAARMNEIFLAVKVQVPDSVASLPPSQRESALAEFRAMISEIAADALKLRDAFVANDNRTAADIVNHMNLDKREGHDKFDK